MDPGTIAAGAAGAGSLIGSLITNEQNRGMANKQMRFQRYMSDTAHQREVADLKKAGLNPILSANSGASTPQGASATMENALGAGISTAMEARRLKKDLAQADASIALADAQKSAQEAAAQRDNTTAKQIATQTEILKHTGAADISEAAVRKKQADIDNKLIKYDNIQRRVKDAFGTVNSAKDAINPFTRGEPGWIGTGKDGTKYHKQTGEVLRRGR